MQTHNAQLRRWVFCNKDEKLTKEVAPELMTLKQKAEKANIKLEVWGFKAFWNEIKQLPITDLDGLFGESPTEASLDELAFPEIGEVIKYICDNFPKVNRYTKIKIPPKDKVHKNGLSDINIDAIIMGRRQEKVVSQYFNQIYDKTEGNRISETYKSSYDELKLSGMKPDDIFEELLGFTGVHHFTGQKNLAAVYAILSYFFSACDIFEDGKNEKP
ncbi:Hypothetical protein PBC10988_23030 [Planctomycetales bacterium 10988]|nr:Hypothetical protein PBC10988_23030 [Planctomycetales bacterium 10988]